MLLFVLGSVPGLAQPSGSGLPVHPELLAEPWPAQWITHPDADPEAFGVYHFRHSFALEQVPESFVVHTSADNRYRLFVNGTPVTHGPARGDVAHWRFETTDLAAHLRPGKNTLAAVVWNFGAHRPVAQMTYETGFILQADAEEGAPVNTGEAWKVVRNEAYAPIPRSEQELEGYFVVGPGERVDGRVYPWGWQEPAFDDAAWAQARTLRAGMPRAGPGPTGIYEAWKLVPRSIPALEKRVIRFAAVDRAEGVGAPGPGFVQGAQGLVVPPRTEATLLLDQAHLTTAYPEMVVSGGAGSRVTLTYGESLYNADGTKGDRDAIAGKVMRGYHDVFMPDGGAERLFRPLWWRTYRYVQVEVETAGDSLRIHDLRAEFTAYPFEEKATFASSEPLLEEIWEVGWRTARVCAGETYFDTPYWEQLQYVGDTRLQALISLYVDGDDRLVRKAIRAYDHSRTADGLTASRYPASEEQFIGPYSLLWIAMVHDYWMHRDDPAFVRSFLTPIRGIVEWYDQYVDDTGLVGPVPWWNFVDWNYPVGVPPGAEDGHSVVVSLQFAYVLDYAAALAEAFDRASDAQYYRALSTSLKEAAHRHAWDVGRGLLADTPDREAFSQHANVLGVLTDAIAPAEQEAVMQRVLADTSLAQATYYFSFYVHRALKKTGLGGQYVEQLGPWREMLAQNLTTFAEEPTPTRSDSHAWSAHPNYNMLALVAGIRPSAPAFETVRIAPALGPLEHVQASVPHPRGPIRVELERRGEDGLQGAVILPDGLTGTFEWQGQTLSLNGGRQAINL